MFKRSIAKLILVLQWASVSALVATALFGAVIEWRAYADAVRILRLTEADRVLFDAVTAIRFEVGTHGVALLSLDDPQVEIAESTRKIDAAYRNAVAALAHADLPERDKLVAAIEDAHRTLEHRRPLVGDMMADPLMARDIMTIEPWRQAIFVIASNISDASVAVGNTLRMLDTTVAELVLVRREAYAIRDHYGKPCSDLRGEVQRNQPLSQQTFANWRQDVGAYSSRWQDLGEQLRRIDAPSRLVEDVTAGQEKTADVQQRMDKVIYGLDGSATPAMPAADWSNMCVSAYGSILKVGYDALDLAIDHAQTQKSKALLLLVGSLTLLAAVLFLGAISVLIVQHRLSSPMTALVTVIGRLSRREFSQPVPPTDYSDELGVMAGALEDLRIGALAAQRLQQRLDEAREAQIERASQDSRAKSAFLATMSHEVRTPLNGILGMVQLLQGSTLSPQQRQWLEAVSSSGAMLLAILNDILDYSKIEAGGMKLESIVFSPRELIQTVSATVAPQAASKKVVFRSTLPRDLPGLLQGDPAKLSQVLLNLLGNAVKFTSSGTVMVTVRRLKPTPRERRARLAFQISDTGIGIAPEAIERLFEAFAQSDSSITRRFGGTGLGLAICKRIVEAMGGTITVESVLGKGSTFTVTLDFAIARRARQRKGTKAQAGAIPPLSILLAEDNEVNAMVATAILNQMGHAVTLATDGARAVALATANDYDLVMMDLAMPKLDGISATQQIRNLPHATRCQVPIIALTANVSQTGIADCFAAGMTGFLGKPFQQAELLRAIADAIGADVAVPKAPLPGFADFGLLAERAKDLGLDRAGRIVTLFATTTPPLVADLERAVVAGDADRTRDCAHRLKSAAGNVGLGRLAELAADAERATEREAAGELGHLVRLITAKAPQDIAALEAAWAKIVSSHARQRRNRPRVR